MNFIITRTNRRHDVTRVIAKSLLFISAIVLLEGRYALAQNDLKPSIIPPNPEAAQLGRYGEYELNTYTGAPNISIPIYEVRENDIVLPIGLTYDATGIRVSQTSSWVGLGWVLNAGGVITRSSRGKTDGTAVTDYKNISQGRLVSASSAGQLSGSALNDAKGIINGDIDGEPDLYFFNFAGRSGKFIETPDSVFCLDRTELKITRTSGVWTIIDENGFKYRFADYEETMPQNYKEITDFVSAWYLTSITSPGGSLIEFEYKVGGKEKTPVLKTSSYDVSYSPTTGLPLSINNNRTVSSYTYSKRRILLERITFSTGEVVFNSTEGRLDGATSDSANPTLSPGYILNSIDVLSSQDDTLSRIEFSHSYFHNGSTGYSNYRLKLDGIIQARNAWDILNNKNPVLRHSFEYYSPSGLPSTESESIDHWGYYKEGASLLPTYNLSTGITDYSSRNAGSTAQTAGTLSKVFFPTGGHTEFIYEAHDYSRIANTLVTENIVTPLTVAVRAKKPADPSNQWYDLAYSPAFEITSQSSNVQVDIDFTYSQLPNAEQLRIEVVAPTFNNLPVNEEGIDLESLRPQDMIDEEVVKHWWANSPNVQEPVTLPNGIYFLRAVAEANTTQVIANLTLNQITGVRKVKPAGGLRIQKIVSYDPFSGQSLTKKFEYIDAADSLRSSGVLVTPVTYEILRKQVLAHFIYPQYYDPDMPTECRGTRTDHLEIRSSSAYALGETSGSHVGYKRVIVKSLDSNGVRLGKIVETFTAPDQWPDQTLHFPYVTGTNYDNFRGKLLTKSIYDSQNRIINKEENTYEFHYQRGYYGVAIHDAYSHTGSASVLNTCAFDISVYENMVSKAILKNTVRTDYSYTPTTQSLVRKTNYYTDKKSISPLWRSHTFPTKIVEWTDAADSVTTLMTYVIDNTGGGVWADLYNRHIVAPVTDLEKTSSRLGSPIYKKKDYYQFFGSRALLHRIEEAATGGALVESIRFDAYDSLDRIVQLSERSGLTESFVWNKVLGKPAARIVNASHTDVYINDFENSSGNNPDSHSGAKSRTGGFTKVVTGLTNGLYWLQYRRKTGTSWVLISSEVTAASGNYTISITGQVDDVRLFPKASLVTTYIYDSAARLTCSINENNIPTFFEYDSLGRLTTVRDHDKNIKVLNQYNLVNH